MKRYLVIFLFMFSFIANSSVVASVWLGKSKAADTIQLMSVEYDVAIPIAEMSDHCHEMKAHKTFSGSNCDMQLGGVCDNCFTHCGGALISAVFPSFIAQPAFWFSAQASYYTPLLTFSFLRPPQAS